MASSLKYILALDQGTTGTTACLLDAQANLKVSVNIEHPQIYPEPGWVEHDPNAIWDTVVASLGQALKQSGAKADEVAAIGITNQRETVVMWNAQTGKPLYNAIVWQCRRTTDFCNRLKKLKVARLIQKKTGLVVDPYFSGSKIMWLLDNVSGARKLAREGKIKVGTIDSYLMWRLTGGAVHKTDVSNASRTQLMNIETGKWDAELLKIFNVSLEILPEIHPSSGEFGYTRGVPGLPDGIPISGVAGDQQSALFGQTCFAAGDAKCTFGTGSFLLMNTGHKRVVSKSGLLTTIGWQLKGDKKMTYALEGGAFICGAAVQWLRDELQVIKSSAEIEELAGKVDSTGGVYFVPAFVGLGAPYWDPGARAAIVGMTRGTGRGQIARATLEAMALQNVDILAAMEKDLGKKLKVVRVDGGAVHNDLLMKLQADFLGVPVQRPKATESTVMGAAFLAGLGVGFWENVSELKKVWTLDKEFTPTMKTPARLTKLKEWHHSIEMVRS